MKVLIIGAGELASSTAHRLVRCGFRVVMTEIAEPLAVRRTVAFCSAVFDGTITVEGILGRHYASAQDLPTNRAEVAVIVDPELTLVSSWQPDVLVDARLLKQPGATSMAQASLVISLGPGARCGREAHVVIETHRGHDLGRIITTGGAAPDTGIPGAIGGVTGQRVLRAPLAGQIRTLREIGDQVVAGEVVALVSGTPVPASIDGVLRGVVHDGVQVTRNLKVGDIDPRGDRDACFTLSDKSRTISGAVLEAILHRFQLVQ